MNFLASKCKKNMNILVFIKKIIIFALINNRVSRLLFGG